MSLGRFRIQRLPKVSLIDVFLVLSVVLLVVALVGIAQLWVGPFKPTVQIDLSTLSLCRYALLSLFRVVVAYFFSLTFALVFGYLAAKSKRLEPLLVSMLDILQSIPVLGFMPGLVLGLVYIFPDSNIGLELAAVIMIFTGQAWNMVFSVYSSIKGVPSELRDLSSMLRLSSRQVFTKVELPFAANGLLWNSMLSVAGGWFFLMVIESFTLGDQDFRLPGIGSYMALAYQQGDSLALVLGVMMMFALIIIVDRAVWAPLVVWSERFRIDASRDSSAKSLVYDWLRRSDLLHWISEWRESRAKEREANRKNWAVSLSWPKWSTKFRPFGAWGLRLVFGALLVGFVYYGFNMAQQFLFSTTVNTWLNHLAGTGLTGLRVAAAVVIGSLWTIPVGVFIGSNPVWTRRLQPVIQVVASFPFPMLFPMIAFSLIGLGVELGIVSVLLLCLASQWYILFNVISGASLVPSQIFDLSKVFNVRGYHYWKSIILPAIFPSLVNGWITAAGGAWNASIVAEWVQSGDRKAITQGIGASISEAALHADFSELASGIITMVVTVILINRFFWGYLYGLAETRYRMDM